MSPPGPGEGGSCFTVFAESSRFARQRVCKLCTVDVELAGQPRDAGSSLLQWEAPGPGLRAGHRTGSAHGLLTPQTVPDHADLIGRVRPETSDIQTL